MQRRATSLKAVEHQLPLLSEPPIVSDPVSIEKIHTIRTPKAALMYACQLANVEAKEIYSRMGKDATRWSRICSGEFDLPSGDITKLNKTLGNNAFLLCLNHWDGIDLASIRKAQDDKDKRIEQLEKDLAHERAEKQAIAKFIRETLR